MNQCSVNTPSRWIEEHELPIIIAISILTSLAWGCLYLSVPFPSIFGDEFNTFALTRAAAFPEYNLADYPWLFEMRGSMTVFSYVYQAVHLWDGHALALAQVLNAICVGLSVPLIWTAARCFLGPRTSVLIALMGAFFPTGIMGAHFVLEPLFYLVFWGLVATTARAACGKIRWCAFAGITACILFNIKPHGIVAAAWSFGVMGLAVLCPLDLGNRRSRLLGVALWIAGYGLTSAAILQLSHGTSSATMNGNGFYGSVMQHFANPAEFLRYLHAASDCLLGHFGLYGVIFAPCMALAVLPTIDIFPAGARLRPLQFKDLFAFSLPALAIALLCMALAYSAFVNETHRVHGRYWSYALLPTMIAAAWFFTNPLRSTGAFRRSFPFLVAIAAAVVAFELVPHGLQATHNDCPEVHWLSRGSIRSEGQRLAVYALLSASLFSWLLYLFRPQPGARAAVAGLLMFCLAADYFGISASHRSSRANAECARLSEALRAHTHGLLKEEIMIIAPENYMAGAVMFGMPLIPQILARTRASTLSEDELGGRVRVIAVLGAYQLPPDFHTAWSEGDCSLLVKAATALPAASRAP